MPLTAGICARVLARVGGARAGWLRVGWVQHRWPPAMVAGVFMMGDRWSMRRAAVPIEGLTGNLTDKHLPPLHWTVQVRTKVRGHVMGSRRQRGYHSGQSSLLARTASVKTP